MKNEITWEIEPEARSAMESNSDFMSKIELKAEDLMIPPHPTHKIGNLILLTLYSFILQVATVIIEVEEDFRRLES